MSDVLQGLDGRTKAAKRVRQLVDAYSAALGGDLDPIKADAVRRCAELQVAAEDARHGRLAGDVGVTAEALVKLENAADRARRSLRIGDALPRTIRPIRERLREAAA